MAWDALAAGLVSLVGWRPPVTSTTTGKRAAISIVAAANRSTLTDRVVPFNTGDGFVCNLINVRGGAEPHRGPVLLVHGAGVRANIFRAPVATSLVDALVAHGYDVWLENWRASIDFPPNEWTLDQAALFDHPRAVETIVRETGSTRVKAVIHCQGSTSFMMSAVAGLLPQVSTIVTNAVSLHPIVPGFSRLKLRAALPMLGLMTDYLNPQWGLHAPTTAARLVSALVKLTHHECDNAVCKQVSFTYGSGFPALWRHENLNAATHHWIQQEFAHVPLTFFRQITKCVLKGHLVSVDRRPELPDSFVAQAPETTARIAFFAGEKNRCFLPESQRRTYEYFVNHRRGAYTMHLLPTYGHLDVFMGQDAAREVFPAILGELDKTN